VGDADRAGGGALGCFARPLAVATGLGPGLFPGGGDGLQ
jgi:hypothetical protein